MSSRQQVLDMVEAGLYNQPRKSEDELRGLVKNIAMVVDSSLDDLVIEGIAREIESKQGIKVGLGAIVDSVKFKPWLDDAKSEIAPFYWKRYEKLLLKTGLPRDVITGTDIVTDKILGRLGNPKEHSSWDRRGMVVGHVQSGKTLNYTSLICKAADAGYRLIIVVAGIHNNLRNQTQIRIDEGFIGRDTGKTSDKKSGNAKHVIGVGHFDPNRTPVSLTNTSRDFNKSTASTNTSEIDSYRVPVVLVIKKNHRTLENLLEWLRDNSARGDKEMIDQPMLLIDDEADNASINTKYSNQLVTKINGQIRDLLKMFHRSCYVGYTATPFANIFIDPDDNHDVHKEDLFPKDFIIGLDAPTNYFGPKKIFIDGLPDDEDPTWLRIISGLDNEDLLPIKHKIDHEIEQLPDSLMFALRTFLLSRAIRNLRGQSKSHCSMLVNASRFTRVQTQLKNRLHEALERIQNSLRLNSSLTTALKDPEIKALFDVWEAEYQYTEFDWDEIQKTIFDAIASAKVVEVNSKANELDYSNTGDRGQTVIAVGGFSLSRGLTLEGLTVTWFLRNTMMYDTLMQMGRWFGYRNGFEDLCRIWMPIYAIDWYAFIANAAEELHDELKTMEQAKATPEDFGLAVRSHPASLLVTAKNKMGDGKKVVVRVGLSNKFIETARISHNPLDLKSNLQAAQLLVTSLKKHGCSYELTEWGHFFSNVPVHYVDEFLAAWINSPASTLTNTHPVRDYINSLKDSDLKYWDLLVPSLKTGNVDTTLGLDVIPTNRSVLEDDANSYISFSGKGMRVASRGIEKAGVPPELAIRAEDSYREKKKNTNYPDSIYRQVRVKPLFVLHFVRPKAAAVEEEHLVAASIPQHPVIAWGMSLPFSDEKEVEYIVNTQRYKELYGEDDIDEEYEAELNG
ncbi:Z1 domain-containing protein [Vibrio cholerae]|uniref:Z1 domain-containing protein n=1 Tax=Vibrio cholerae TaxID=666 RepID=UPI0002A32FD3|nr:Z1 domain-containing protein [Vibrio cholerae]EGQ8096581.1 Z1 domain-containing protein [Vibrio cholerae]EKY31547.1 Endonuclease [Vibrio cholerae PS15]